MRLGDWLADPTKPDVLPKPSPFFHYQDKDEHWPIGKDFSEDAWIAQENLWIQREIYTLIKKANEYVSVFEPRVAKKKAANKYAFSNPYWDLELELDRKKSKVAVHFKNLLPRGQKLDFKLKVYVNQKIKSTKKGKGSSSSGPLNVAPLNPAGFSKDRKTADDGFDWHKAEFDLDLRAGLEAKDIYRVEQMLTWETAAVRRLDAIHIQPAQRRHPGMSSSVSRTHAGLRSRHR